MPDGPRYEDDFYAWTQYQAEFAAHDGGRR